MKKQSKSARKASERAKQVARKAARKAEDKAHRAAVKEEAKAHRAAVKSEAKAHRAAAKAEALAHKEAVKAERRAHLLPRSVHVAVVPDAAADVKSDPEPNLVETDLPSGKNDAREAYESANRSLDEARSLTSQARLTARIVVGLPVAGLIICEVASPGTISGVVSSSLSRTLVLGAVGLQVAAVVAVRRVARLGASGA